MGTASTMACVTAALGLMPLRGATAPAVSSLRLRIAEETGRTAAAVAAAKRTLAQILTKSSFINAITVLQAIGGSTNVVVHLLAILNRHPDLKGQITLADFDASGCTTPLLVDLKPSGDNYMTDFGNAGGMVVLMHTLRPLLHLDALTITGATLGEVLDQNCFRVFPYTTQVIRPLIDPILANSALVVLKGNIAPQGAVMKQSASKDRSLLSHYGPAVVFENTADMTLRIDDPDLLVTRDSVLVLKGVGPVGNPGMPEAGLIPIPRKLAAKGVLDMLRLSDGRMSGTAGGSIVLHISPEAAQKWSVFGIVQTGDMIRCDVERRMLELEVEDEEIKTRLVNRAQYVASEEGIKSGVGVLIERQTRRGYQGLYERCVNQAHEGTDFDFMTAQGPRAAEGLWNDPNDYATPRMTGSRH
jgi:dihydroxy-acid dehydratase